MNVVILITCVNSKEAKKVSHALIANRLAACVNRVLAVESMFWWDKKIDTAKEVLLIVKSKKQLMNKIIKTVKANHSYSVPEIIALPIISGNKDYLNWLNDSLR